MCIRDRDTIDRVSGEGVDWESRERGLVGRNKEILSGKNRDGCRPSWRKEYCSSYNNCTMKERDNHWRLWGTERRKEEISEDLYVVLKLIFKRKVFVVYIYRFWTKFDMLIHLRYQTFDKFFELWTKHSITNHLYLIQFQFENQPFTCPLDAFHHSNAIFGSRIQFLLTNFLRM